MQVAVCGFKFKNLLQNYSFIYQNELDSTSVKNENEYKLEGWKCGSVSGVFPG